MGISAKVLIQATTNDPESNTVRDLQSALRARYDAADWRDVVRPINDEMRWWPTSSTKCGLTPKANTSIH